MKDVLGIMLFIVLLPIILPIGLVVLTLWILASIFLHLAIWSLWCSRGKDILFVYSDSPIWHDYIEERVLPKLRDRAIILNWSQRKQWHFSLARMAFRHFGNYREFNPLGIVFRPFRRTRRFRFWQPFRDFKHGHPEALAKIENEFFRSAQIPSD
jgi:hypothetical protein